MAPVAMVTSNHAQVKWDRRPRIDTFWWRFEVSLAPLPVTLCASSSSSLIAACVCVCRLDRVDIDAESVSFGTVMPEGHVRGYGFSFLHESIKG